MREQEWMRETPTRHEEVHRVEGDGYEQRHEIIENRALAQHQAISKVTGLIWLLFGILEAAIGLRVVLLLVGANPSAPFASLVYNFTDLFLWPFAGLTASPAVGNMVLEIPSLIAMLVYALIAWAIVKVIWLVFDQHPTTTISRYEDEDLPR
jgi:hypothetical protein